MAEQTREATRPGRKSKKQGKCANCGNVYNYRYGDIRGRFCSHTCYTASTRKYSSKSAKEREKRRRLIASGWKPKPRPERDAARNARRRAATIVEAVNPFVVFTRDGWRCRSCKKPTPRELRGTVEPRAPELDHIEPLSKGGEHSYRNTQLLCRKCNLEKRANPVGQLHLGGW